MNQAQAMNDVAPQPAAPEPKPKRTLDAIVTDYLNELYLSEGEVTLNLEALDLELEDKGLAYQYAAKKLRAAMAGEEAQAAHFMKDVKRHQKRFAAIENSLAKLQERLAMGMRVAQKPEMRTVLGKIYFRAFPVVKLAEDWAKTYAEKYAQYVAKTEPTYAPKKTLLLHDFKQHLADFKKAFPDTADGRARAWQAALSQMPEGFEVDPNEQLCGV